MIYIHMARSLFYDRTIIEDGDIPSKVYAMKDLQSCPICGGSTNKIENNVTAFEFHGEPVSLRKRQFLDYVEEYVNCKSCGRIWTGLYNPVFRKEQLNG